MNSYQFETDKFGLSNTAIHLLRSGYNYKTIEFSSIHEINIEKGRQIKNWLITLLLGISLIVVALYVAYRVIYEYFFGHTIYVFYIEQFLFPILPLAMGIYCVYIALKTGWVLQIRTEEKTINLPIASSGKKLTVNELLVMLNGNNLTKHKTRSIFIAE